MFARDHLLANVSLYWFTGAIGSSFWPYYACLHGKPPLPVGATIDTPMAYSEFPRELIRPPRSVAERVFTNIQRWTTMEWGGHFAAMEQPDALAAEIRAAFRPLRQASWRVCSLWRLLRGCSLNPFAVRVLANDVP